MPRQLAADARMLDLRDEQPTSRRRASSICVDHAVSPPCSVRIASNHEFRDRIILWCSKSAAAGRFDDQHIAGATVN